MKRGAVLGTGFVVPRESGGKTVRYPNFRMDGTEKKRRRFELESTTLTNAMKREVFHDRKSTDTADTATRMTGAGIARRAGLDGNLRLDGYDPFVLEQFGG